MSAIRGIDDNLGLSNASTDDGPNIVDGGGRMKKSIRPKNMCSAIVSDEIALPTKLFEQGMRRKMLLRAQKGIEVVLTVGGQFNGVWVVHYARRREREVQAEDKEGG